MVRTQIFGDPAEMGSEGDVMKDLRDMDEQEAAAAQEEKELAEQEELQKKLSKRGNKKLMKFT